ncbi:MAG: hypothetical protein ACYC91_00045 [Solirubrobacteraceae bacterium]
MTPTGLDRIGLGQLPAARAPNPFSPQTLRSTRVAWAAADIEHAGHQWIASRELALAPGRWGAEVANERGGRSRRLPDLVFWPACNGRLQVAVVVAQGLSNPRRERAAFEGWRDSIVAGRYAQVRYLAGPAAASHLRHLATDIGLTAPQLIAGEHVMADELPELLPIIENDDEESVAADPTPVAAPDFPRSSAAHIASQCSTLEEPAEMPEQAAVRQKLINEVLGHGEPARRRRWRPGST